MENRSENKIIITVSGVVKRKMLAVPLRIYW